MGRHSNITAPTLTIVANSHDASPSTTPMRPTPLIGSWGDYEWGMDMKTAVLTTATESGAKKPEQQNDDSSSDAEATPDHMVLARRPTEEHIEVSASAPAPVAVSPVERETANPLSATFGDQQQLNSSLNSSQGYSGSDANTPMMRSYSENYHAAPVIHHHVHVGAHPAPQVVVHTSSQPQVHNPYGAYTQQQQQFPQQQAPQSTHPDDQAIQQAVLNYVAQQRQILDQQAHTAVPAPSQQLQQQQRPAVNAQQQVSKPRAPVPVSRFAPPPPPTANLDAILMRDGSPDGTFYSIVMRWYERAVLAQAAHPKVKKCPPAEEYLHDFPGWLKEVEKWWKSNFGNRKGKARLQYRKK